MKTDITSPLVKYTTYLFITLGLIGVLFPIVSHIWYPSIAFDSIGAGIIIAVVFGGIGSAFWIRRRDALKQLKIKAQMQMVTESKARRFNNSFDLKLDSKIEHGHWSTDESGPRKTKYELEQQIKDLEAYLAGLTRQLDDEKYD